MVSQKLYTVSVDELFYMGNKTNNTCVYVRNNMPIYFGPVLCPASYLVCGMQMDSLRIAQHIFIYNVVHFAQVTSGGLRCLRLQ